ncbi:mandelate racemase/muconate lactonizing enzyme family protein [Vibrio artabrorum]|uniref:mandelate racemase/muconate lactonizing enzyme family protein n=1 Tax=Vibrio artabrorum TaxID=446374 RepID=UPI003552370A
MKIKNIKCHAISVPLETPFYFSQGWVYSRSAMIVEILTDENISGFGECLCHGLQSPKLSQAFIENTYKEILIGRSPFDISVLWDEMYNRSRPYGQSGIAINAISGVDIALWDIVGKALNKPIHQLIGGAYRTEITPYATGFYREANRTYPQESIIESRRHIENGFKAFKIKIGFGVNEDIELIKSIREEVGYDIKIMADANGAYNTAEALKLIRAIEPYKLTFLEELLSPEDIDGYKAIVNQATPFIAAGEQIFSKYGFRPWIENKALDIIQPDVCSSGGITELKKISAMAQAKHIMMIPHVWGSGIGIAASIQLLASLPNASDAINAFNPLLEFDQSSHPFRTDLIYHGIEFSNGTVKVPMEPGIGVNVNKDILDKYKV